MGALLRDVLVPHDRLDGAPVGTEVVLSAAFRSILHGAASTIDALSATTGIPRRTARAAIEALAARGRVARSDDDRVVAAAGLSLEPTPHMVVLSGVILHAWCALDAIGIPAALQRDAVVRSTCARCGQPIRCVIERGEPCGDCVASVPARVCSKPREQFCPRSRFFCRDAHAREWLARDGCGPALVLEPSELAGLGRAVWDWTNPSR
ncbi:MAG: organomercurial lyase [Dehalococcoidia bacterium]